MRVVNMWFNRYVFLLFLYFTSRRHQVRADNGLTELETLAQEIGIKSHRVTDALSHVYVKDSKYEIYYYDGNDSEEEVGGRRENLLSKFYICMNCIFATWTRGELFKFVELFPVLFSWKFETIHNNVFRAIYDEKIVPTCKGIAKYTLRFIDVLFSFMDKVTYSSLVDTSLLKALLSLNFKINYMYAAYSRPFVDDDGTYSERGIDVSIVQLLLEVISEIQNFIAVNCPLSDYYTNNMFFYYLEPSPNEVNVTDFLDNIGPMRLELTDGERCDLDKLLLTNILNKWEEIDTSILRGILFLNYNVGCDEELMFYDIYDIIEPVYDLQVIHWYQQVVSNTIMSLLFAKINRFFKEYKVNNAVPIVKEAFQMINDTILPAYNNLPVKIVESFELLASKDQYDQVDVERLKDTISRAVLLPAAEARLESYRFTDTDEEQLMTLLNSSLEDFLKDLLRNFGQLTCFLQLFRYLNVEYNTYYTSFNKDYNKIVDKISTSDMCRWRKNRSTSERKKQILKQNFYSDFSEVEIEFTANDNVENVAKDPSHEESTQSGSGPDEYFSEVDDGSTADDNADDATNDPSVSTRAESSADSEKTIVDKGCDFFTGLIHQCTVILDHIINGFSPSASDDDDDDGLNSTLVRDRLNVIRSSLHAAHTGYLDRRIQRIAYNLLPIIDINFKRDFGDSRENRRLRMMSLIAVELNYYGLEYCRPPKRNFLQYNNLNIDSLGNVSFYENDIRRFIESIQNTKKLGRGNLTRLGQFKLVELDGVFAEYLNNSRDYDSYRNAIKIRWKGENKSVGEIYNGLVYHVSRPFYYYAFADVLLKFAVATLFYEVERFELINTMDSGRYLRLLETVIKAVRPTKSYIKRVAGDVVDEMQTVYFSAVQKKDNATKLYELGKKIINEFNEIGVSINVSLPKIANSEFPQETSESYDGSPQSSRRKNSYKIEEFEITIVSITKTITSITKSLNEYVAYIV